MALEWYGNLCQLFRDSAITSFRLDTQAALELVGTIKRSPDIIVRSRIIFPLLLILATVCGCLKFKQSHRSTGFHAANRDEKHCGICTWDGATVCVFLIPNSQGSFTRTATRPTYQGEFRWTDETTTAWSVQTPNGRNGTVRIKDREFDLADGCYFLVSKESGQMTVDQFDAELIQTNSADSKDAFEQLKDLAPSNPQIAKFLK